MNGDAGAGDAIDGCGRGIIQACRWEGVHFQIHSEEMSDTGCCARPASRIGLLIVDCAFSSWVGQSTRLERGPDCGAMKGRGV